MRICLTILNHDFKCRRMVSDILQYCTYEELHTGRLLDTLKAIWENKDTIDYVVTNLHKLGAKGSSMLEQLKRKNLRISRITPGDEIPEWKGEEIDLSAYVLDVPSMEDMNNLLAFAVAKDEAANQEGSSAQVASETRATEPLPVLDEQSEASGDENPVERKTRVVWTKEMHRKFLEAIEILGPDNSFPKKIVELMNEPGLTRENVASHLQKYRMCLRRNQEEAASSNSGVKLSLPSSDSALSFSFSRRYSRVNLQPYSSPFQQGSGGIISVPYLGLSHSLAGTGSFTSISSLRPANLLVGSIQEGIQQQQCGLMQTQSYISRCRMLSGFRIYGDETRSMLLSSEDGSSSSSATSPSNSQNFNTFIGLRVTGDGNLEFGQTSLSGSNEIETSTISLVGTSGTEILDHSNPLSSVSYAPKPPNTLPQEGSLHNEVPDHSNLLKSASYAQKPPNALPQEGSYQNEVSDHFPSIFSDWTSEEYQEILALLTAPLEEDVTLEGNVTDCSSLLVEGNEQDQFLPSGASFPLVKSSTSLQREPDSFRPEEDIYAFLNEQGSSSPDKFWEGVYQDADISRFH